MSVYVNRSTMALAGRLGSGSRVPAVSTPNRGPVLLQVALHVEHQFQHPVE